MKNNDEPVGTRHGVSMTDPGTNDGNALTNIDESAPGINDAMSMTNPGTNDGNAMMDSGTNDGNAMMDPGTNDGKALKDPGTNDGMAMMDSGTNDGVFMTNINESAPGINDGKAMMDSGTNDGVSMTDPGTNDGNALKNSSRTRNGVSLHNNKINDTGPCRGMALLQDHMNKFSKPVKGSLSVVINQYKSSVKKWCNTSGYKNFEWQSRFYDHILRDQESMDSFRTYIRSNPLIFGKD